MWVSGAVQLRRANDHFKQRRSHWNPPVQFGKRQHPIPLRLVQLGSLGLAPDGWPFTVWVPSIQTEESKFELGAHPDVVTSRIHGTGRLWLSLQEFRSFQGGHGLPGRP
jgi:hypothetical protein